MPITKKEKVTLKNAGFFPFEIRQIDSAKSVDGTLQNTNLDAVAWQKTINSRRRWAESRIAEGWTKRDMYLAIRRFYRRRGRRDVFAFLRIEYKPIKRLSDLQWAMKMRSKIRISKTLGKGYGPRMERQVRPIG